MHWEVKVMAPLDYLLVRLLPETGVPHPILPMSTILLLFPGDLVTGITELQIIPVQNLRPLTPGQNPMPMDTGFLDNGTSPAIMVELPTPQWAARPAILQKR